MDGDDDNYEDEEEDEDEDEDEDEEEEEDEDEDATSIPSRIEAHWGGGYDAVPPLGRVNPSRRRAQNPYSDRSEQKSS